MTSLFLTVRDCFIFEGSRRVLKVSQLRREITPSPNLFSTHHVFQPTEPTTLSTGLIRASATLSMAPRLPSSQSLSPPAIENQTLWFFDYNTCGEGGVGAINVNESSSQTLEGFEVCLPHSTFHTEFTRNYSVMLFVSMVQLLLLRLLARVELRRRHLPHQPESRAPTMPSAPLYL